MGNCLTAHSCVVTVSFTFESSEDRCWRGSRGRTRSEPAAHRNARWRHGLVRPAWASTELLYRCPARVMCKEVDQQECRVFAKAHNFEVEGPYPPHSAGTLGPQAPLPCTGATRGGVEGSKMPPAHRPPLPSTRCHMQPCQQPHTSARHPNTSIAAYVPVHAP